MTIKRAVIATILAAPIVAFLAIYIGLVRDGTVPPPDFDAIAHSIGLGTETVAQILIISALVCIALMAMIAPIIFAIRSGDLITVFISLAMTGGAIALLILSRTVIDQISALIIYLANMMLSAIVYAANRIAPNK